MWVCVPGYYMYMYVLPVHVYMYILYLYVQRYTYITRVVRIIEVHTCTCNPLSNLRVREREKKFASPSSNFHTGTHTVNGVHTAPCNCVLCVYRYMYSVQV